MLPDRRIDKVTLPVISCDTALTVCVCVCVSLSHTECTADVSSVAVTTCTDPNTQSRSMLQSYSQSTMQELELDPTTPQAQIAILRRKRSLE